MKSTRFLTNLHTDTSSKAWLPSGARFRLSNFFMETLCSDVLGSLRLTVCVAGRVELSSILPALTTSQITEALVCSDLRQAGAFYYSSVNHMIITIQWNCKIKHCDRSQTPQHRPLETLVYGACPSHYPTTVWDEINGTETCLRCLRHVYGACPSHYPSTVWNEINGTETCLRCLRHVYGACPSHYPSTVWNEINGTETCLRCLHDMSTVHAPVTTPALSGMRLMELKLVYGVCDMSTVHAPVTTPTLSGMRLMELKLVYGVCTACLRCMPQSLPQHCLE